MENYFSYLPELTVLEESVIDRKAREKVIGLSNLYVFYAGDILEIIFYKKMTPMIFRGLCLGVRKTLKSKDYQIILRNSISGCIVEVIVSFYFNRLFTMKILDFRRKSHKYSRAKLYYVRNQVYTSSQV